MGKNKNKKQLLTVRDLWDALDCVDVDAPLSVDVLVNQYKEDDDCLMVSSRKHVSPSFLLGYSIDLTKGGDVVSTHATLTFDLRPNLQEMVITRDELNALRGED